MSRRNLQNLSINKTKNILLVLFFFSGVSGLIYEIAWIRGLTLIFGNTTSAISTVLTTFFAGLALGSLYFGRLIDKKTDVLKIYGVLELGIGIYCLILPQIFTWMESFYVITFQNFSIPFYPKLLIRFVLCFIILIIPTTLMGGTLPVLSRYFVNMKEKLGKSVGSLYSVNTLGAVMGCLIAGFFFIRIIGIKNTIYFAAILNILVGISTFLIKSIVSKYQMRIKEDFSLPAPENIFKEQGLSRIILVVFTLSGFASLAYEIFWSRILILIIGSTTYAFSALLITFLMGIALGSYVFSRVVDNTKNLLFQLGIIEVLIGIFAILTTPVMEILPVFSQRLFSNFLSIVKDSWITITTLQFFLSTLIIFAPTFLMGTTFPLVSRLYALNMEKTGRDIGRVYSFNTLGGIAGSFAGGFLLIPFLGVQHGLMINAFLNISLGLYLFFKNKTLKFSFKAMLSSFFVFLYIMSFIFIPPWKPGIFTGVDRHTMPEGKVIFHKEGIGGAVAVTHNKGIKTLFIDGESESSTDYYSLMTEYLLGYLPLLLHPKPEKVLEVGLGGGVTLGRISNYELKEIDSVEIVGVVREAALLFNRENNYVLSNPKVNLIINDGRNYLLLTKKKYDVITGNTTHPWTAGAANVLSKEYFTLCRNHLNRNGLMSQWIPLQFIYPEDLKSIVKTFHSVFPHTSVWFSNMDIFLIGSMNKIHIDFKRLNENFFQDKIRRDLEKVDISSPFSLLSRFIMDERKLAEYMGDNIHITTDDHPVLEFSAPKNRHVYTLAKNLMELIRYREDTSPIASYIHIDESLDKDEIFTEINKYYNSMTHDIQGIIEENRQNKHDALKEYQNALAINPKDKIAQHNMANIFTAEGFQELYNKRYDEAILKFKEALEIYPNLIDAHSGLSSIYIKKGLLTQAISGLKNIIAIEPFNATAHNNLGGIYGMQGLHEKAFGEFKVAIESDPYHVSSYNNLASFYLIYKKDKNKALPYLKKSLEIDPYQEKADWVKKMLNDLE